MAMPIYTRIQKLRQFPPGRARQAASNVERVAFPLGYHVLHPYTRAASAAARAYVGLRHLRFGENRARGDGEANRIDRTMDVRLGFIHDAANRSANDLAGSAEGDAGARIIRGCFPQGLKPVVSAPYEEELIQVEGIVEALRGELADDVELLAIGRHVDVVEALMPQYAEALDKRRRVSAGELRTAWLGVHHAVLELAFAIVLHVPDPEHQALIGGPIFEQDDRLAALYARRQRGATMDVVDLDVDLLDDDGDGLPFDGDDVAFSVDEAAGDGAGVDDSVADVDDGAPEAVVPGEAPTDVAAEGSGSDRRPLASLPRPESE